MAKLTVINNLFDLTDKTTTDIYAGFAIFHYLDSYSEDIDLVVSLNGKITEDFEYIVKANDFLAVVPVPKGGSSGGKNPFKLIAMLALSIVAPMAGTMLAQSMSGIYAATGIYSATLATVFSGAIMIGGSLLINTLLPSSVASSSTSSSLSDVSPTYAFSGGSNATSAGSTLPLALGKSRVTPPIIGSYLSLSGDKQYLNLLLAVADGKVDSISDIQLNAQDISNFNNVSYQTRLGADTQTAVSGFRDSVTTFSLSRTLEDTTVTEYTTSGNVIQELEIVMNYPSGNFYMTDEGDYVLPSTRLRYKVEYKKSSSSTYTLFKTVTENTVYKTTQRKAIVISGLSPDEYDIRVTRLSAYNTDTRTANSLELEYVNEIAYNDFTYPATSLLYIKAMATDQLSGSMPTVTCIVNKTTYTIESTSATISLSNPAWGCYYLLKQAKIPDSDINLTKFQAWADYCDEEGFTCNLYLDSQQELQSALNMVSILGRATVVQMGSVFNPIVSNVVEETQGFLFTSGNIIESSFQMDYISHADRANIVEITYYDADDDYTAKTVQVQSHDFDATTEENKSSITLYGCTDRTIALRYAQFLINQNRYITESVTFEADVEAIACTVGDVIRVGLKQMSNTLADGRLVSINENTITFDQEVALNQGMYYELQVRDEDDDIHILDYFHGTENNTTDTITLTNSIPVLTPSNIVFAFGEQSTEATNLYRVTNISRASDQKRKIIGVEYNATVYDDDVSIEIEAVNSKDAVSNLKADTFLIKNQDNSFSVGIALSWTGNKLAYKVYYKKASDSDYTYYTSTSSGYAVLRDLDYGETYDIKVENKVVSIVYQDTTIPAKVSLFTLDGATKEMKTLNFSMTEKPIDFAGYEIRYQLGNYPYWDTATPLSDDLITQSPYSTDLLTTKGTYTIMIKAVDIFGNKSVKTANMIFTQNLSLYQNLVYTMDFQANGFSGEKINCSVNGEDYLEATDSDENGNYDMSYTGIFYPDVGSTAKVVYEGDGSPQVYYRSFGDEEFYGDTDDTYKLTGDYIFREATQNPWVLYSNGFTAKADTPYEVKLVYTDSEVKPIIREFKVEIDAVDVLETLNDIDIPIEGLRVYSTDIDEVKWVGGVLQDTGTTATAVRYLKYSDGAFIKVYDSDNSATTGLVDILMKGYNNG